MLIRKPQVHIVTREVALATGELVRAYFAVIEGEGFRDIRFLGTKPVQKQTEKVLMLEAPRQKSVWSELFIPTIFERVSPYFALDFLVSQLARAPNAN